MAVKYDEQQKIFHIFSKNTSYVTGIVREKYLTHLYWGKRIREYHGSRSIVWKDRGFAPNPDDTDRTFSLDTLPQEYPQTGNGDFRSCAYGIRQENGSRISNLEYAGYEIVDGKEGLPGLPASFGRDDQVQTLYIHMKDPAAGLKVRLAYSVFYEADVITRSVVFENASGEPLTLTKMLSMSVDFRKMIFMC